MAANESGFCQKLHRQADQQADDHIKQVGSGLQIECHRRDQHQQTCGECAEQRILSASARRPCETRPAQHREQKQQWIFRDPVEDMRCDQPGCYAADRPADRDPHVIAGEVARRRPAAGEFAVTHQDADEEHTEMQRYRSHDRFDRTEHECGHERENENRLHPDDERVGDDRTCLEHDHEGNEIKRKRQHPEQRHRRNIGCDMRGYRDQKAGRHRCKKHPPGDVAPARWRCGFNFILRGGASIAQHQHAAGCDQGNQEIEARGPEPGLRPEPDERLDRNRIGDERKETSGIARSI